MLYDRWESMARQRRQTMALADLAAQRTWTFGQLLDRRPSDQESPVALPQGAGPEFVFAVLDAWRAGRPVCPLEAGQSPPQLSGLPPGTAHVKMTSATTGQPRLILFDAGQLVADADNIIATMGLTPDCPNLGVISLAHSYGFSNLVLPLLLDGIPLYLLDSPLPESVRRAANIPSSFTLPAVPAMWRAWHEAGAIPDNLRRAISAGAPLPVSLEAAVYQRHGVKIHNFYGASECGGIAYDRSSGPREDEGCVGTAMTGVDLSVNEAGCLTVCSRAVGASYWPKPDPLLQAGRFQTGDLAEILDGVVHLKGRNHDVINVAGRKLHPGTVEAMLAGCPDVEQCLVLGLPGGSVEQGEAVAACVVVKPGIDSRRLQQWLLSRLPAWQVPKHWWLLDTLPVNARGKHSRAQWRERFLERLGEGGNKLKTRNPK